MLVMTRLLKSRLVLLLLVTGCATAGATLGSGVGDTYLEHAPYYAGHRTDALAGNAIRLGHVPVAFQPGASQPAMFDPRTGSQLNALLAEMNTFLDSLGVSTRLVEDVDSRAMVPKTAIPPDVRFGCIPEHMAAGGDCRTRGDSALGRGRQQMQLAVGRPSGEWVSWMAGIMRDKNVDRTLVVTLEVGQYLLRQEGWRGTKILELGTGHRTTLPWLTSLDTPVAVLQLTAALVGPDGKAIRIGAEGFHARRSRLLVSAVGGQELFRDEDVSVARTQRRDDVPGRPLAWQVAMREVVAGVTGTRPER